MLLNKLKYLLILIIAGFLAILYNEYFMGILFLTVMILPFLLFAILSYIYGKLSFELVSDVHVGNKGDTIPITIQIYNPTLFPIANLSITLSYSNTFSDQVKDYKRDFYVSVDCRSKTTAVCNLKSEHAGNLVISISRVRIYDYLKIFSLRKKDVGEIKIAVLPYYYELTEDYLKNASKMQIESDYYSSIKSGDDPSEVFVIREYREGDRPQRIHWKLSFKQDQLMIKEFSEPLNCSVVIFADLCIAKANDLLDTIDAILECTLSLSYTFMLRGQIHYISWYDKIQGTCKRVRIVTEKDFFEAVDGLLNSGSFTEEVDLAATYFAEYPNDQYTDVFYVTSMITHKKLDSIILIKAMGRQIICINKDACPDTEQHLEVSDEMVRKISEIGIGLYSISIANINRDLEDLKLN